MLLTEKELFQYKDSPNACWVQDIDRARAIWANHAAVTLFQADSADEFYSRQLTPLSKASKTRLETYRTKVSKGNTHKTQWTTYVNNVTPLTLLASVSGYKTSDSRIALFFEAKDISSTTCAESLRMLESARQSFFCHGQFALDGTMLEQNAAFLRTFYAPVDASSDAKHDDFAALFVAPEEAERARALAIARGEYRSRVKLNSLTGINWYLMITTTIKDPVDGRKVIHAEMTDISSEVEAESRARASEQLLQQIADEMPQPIAYLGADERFGFVNRTYANWSGRQRNEIIGKSIEEVTSQRAHVLLTAGLPKVAMGERYEYERLATIAGAGERWIRVQLIPHIDDAGMVAGSFIFGSDIQALKMAEESRLVSHQQLALISDNLPSAVSLFGLDDRLIFANRPFTSWFGLPHGAATGRHASEIFGPEEYAKAMAVKAGVVAGNMSTHRFEVKLHGKNRWVDITIAPYAPLANNVTGYLAIYTDVTHAVKSNHSYNAVREALARHVANTPLCVIELDENFIVRQWAGRSSETFG